MSEISDTPTKLDSLHRRYHVPAILMIAFDAMFFVITGSWAALFIRFATLGIEPLAGANVESMLLMKTGRPLIIVIGPALHRVPVSPVRKSLIALCLNAL